MARSAIVVGDVNTGEKGKEWRCNVRMNYST